jgi:peptidoglycan/xylan/chitin deacetylase (PgdA/CDA1 family)
MRQVDSALRGGEPLPRNAVAVTVDDGYRDFFRNSHPVFWEFSIPTTVYLVSGFLDRHHWNWWDKIQYALEHTKQTKFELQTRSGRRVFFVRPGQAYTQMHQLALPLKEFTNRERNAEVERLLQQLRVTLSERMPAWCEPMTWDEVRQLAKTNVEFGAHTKTHAILATVDNETELTNEIRGSRKRVEEELNQPVLHFCYPNGRPQDIGLDALRITRESGFRTAVTSIRGMNKVNSTVDPLQLKRLGADPELPERYFAELLAGVRAR